MPPTILVNGRFLGRRITGVERYAGEVTRRLSDRVCVIRARFHRGIAGHLWEQRILPYYLKEKDVLLSLANTGPVSVKRQVVTIHDASVIEHPEWYQPSFAGWYRQMLPKLARNAALVLTDSAYSMIRMIEVFRISPDKVEVIPCGVDPELFFPRTQLEEDAVRQKYDLPEDYVLFVGTIAPRKNLAALLSAWKTVMAQLEGIQLVLAGGTSAWFPGPPMRDIPDRVRWLGYVEDEDLAAIYSAAAVFVMPSSYEGFGLPILEAMACGTPVVAATKTSLPEVVGEAGMLVDAEDNEALAQAILDVLEDGEMASRLAREGIDRAKEFTWERTSEAVWRAAQRLL